jgi:hypothetical protein
MSVNDAECRHHGGPEPACHCCECEFMPAAEGKVLFIAGDAPSNCPCMIGFGSGKVCVCPVQNARHNRDSG